MNCLFCKKEIPEQSQYCMFCGRKQTRSHHRLPNGSGTVYKRGQTYTVSLRYWNGTYRASVSKGGFKTKREALAYVPELTKRTQLHRTEKIGFCELWERVQETVRFQKLSEDKKKTWRYAFAKCSALYGCKDVRELRYEHLQKCIEGMTYYPARDVKVLLSAMYQLAMKMEICTKNYAELMELPKLEQTEKDVFTNEEIRMLWQCMDPFRDYILIMLYCGLRPVEMRKLRTENVLLDERLLTGGQKTDYSKKNYIVIPEIVAPLFERFRPWLFSKSAFEKRFASCLKHAGIVRELSPGCCRHTFVTNLTLVEDSTAMIQKAARHTKYQTTLNYTHIPVDDVRKTVNKLDNIIEWPTNGLQ